MDTNTRARGCAIIVAGGSGTRFGNPGGKLLIDVAGKPLITWTLEAFDAASRVERIVVVCPPEKTDKMHRAAVAPFAFATPIAFAPSGAERQDSTRNGLDSVPADCDIVLVHDAARPLILPETIDAAIGALVSADQAPAFGDSGGNVSGKRELGADYALHGDAPSPTRCEDASTASISAPNDLHALDGVVCGQPAVDTLKVIDAGGCFVKTPPRAKFWTVQTPQVFWADSLRRAYEWADRTGFVGTDDSSLVEGMGGRVRGFDAPRDNLKVTLPEDLAPVEAALHARIQG